MWIFWDKKNWRECMKSLSVCILVMLLGIPSAGTAAGKNFCGELYGTSFGPFDYLERFNLGKQLTVVEAHHFTSDVENLVKGESSSLGGDLHYTLRVWPNHHRALVSLARLSIRDKSTRFHGLKWPVECYFDRAIRFSATDAKVRTIYGGYLSHQGRNKEAVEQLEVAVNLEPDNVTALYNLGLLYFKLKNYDKANEFANRAYALDFPLPGLKNKLIKAGKWRELSAYSK
ncbi:MAG TPA: tetratricopeptide repeat protein [Nitrosomonas halophila]|nr:tetratricopeptide repeat protein [Nitrosomonas halophila]